MQLGRRDNKSSKAQLLEKDIERTDSLVGVLSLVYSFSISVQRAKLLTTEAKVQY